MTTSERSRVIRLATSVGLLAFGLTFIALALGYGLGDLSDFGPGLFPLLFAVALILAIAADMIQTLQDDSAPSVGKVSARRVLFVCASLLAFGILLQTAGFVPAIFVTTALAMRADKEVSWSMVIGYALALTGMSYLIFLRLLGMPLTAFG